MQTELDAELEEWRRQADEAAPPQEPLQPLVAEAHWTSTDLAVQRSVSVSAGLVRTLRTVLSFDTVGNAAVFDQCGLPQPGRTLRLMMTLR